jgi:hypothetical protein
LLKTIFLSVGLVKLMSLRLKAFNLSKRTLAVAILIT